MLLNVGKLVVRQNMVLMNKLLKIEEITDFSNVFKIFNENIIDFLVDTISKSFFLSK